MFHNVFDLHIFSLLHYVKNNICIDLFDIQGPKNTRGYYIACQAPLQNTVDDFWRMIWEQQCRVVLMLTNLYENGIVSNRISIKNIK